MIWCFTGKLHAALQSIGPIFSTKCRSACQDISFQHLYPTHGQSHKSQCDQSVPDVNNQITTQ